MEEGWCCRDDFGDGAGGLDWRDGVGMMGVGFGAGLEGGRAVGGIGGCAWRRFVGFVLVSLMEEERGCGG